MKSIQQSMVLIRGDAIGSTHYFFLMVIYKKQIFILSLELYYRIGNFSLGRVLVYRQIFG